MATTENLLNLKIHKLSQAQYDNIAPEDLESTALYLTPDDSDTRISKLEQQSSQTSSSLTEHSTAIDTLEKSVTNISYDCFSAQSSLDNRLKTLTQNVGDLPDVVSGLDTSVRNIKDAFTWSNEVLTIDLTKLKE